MIMAYWFIALFVFLLTIAYVVFIRHLGSDHHNKEILIRDWPFLGNLPSLLLNFQYFHDWITRLLAQNNCTYVFKGPWFTTNLNMVWTCDPANFRYISNTNFSNFHKGPDFKEIFEVLGEGIFNSDSQAWLSQRRSMQALLSHSRFLQFLKATSWDMMGNELVPFIERIIDEDMAVDFQDVLHRFVFDMMSVLTNGTHPGCLSIEFANVPFAEAVDIGLKTIFRRHCVPRGLWKMQRWLGIGEEGRFKKARRAAEDFLGQCISRKREQLMISRHSNREINASSSTSTTDLLAILMEEEGEQLSDKYLRDCMLTLVLAGRDTIATALTWFFWLVSRHPSVEAKIIEELKANLPKEGKKYIAEEVSGLVYFHAAFCESLRLYPPVPLERLNCVNKDILPSGHGVSPSERIVICIYAMGRMKKIWGEDCLEFKPERWILGNGRIKYEPSNKFSVFYTGPRTCLGKDFAFSQMKMVAATLLYNYHFEVEEGHPVSPKIAVVLHMEHGLMVKIKRRSVLL